MKNVTSIILLSSLLTLSGCASKPTFADRVLAEGESRIDIATQWEAGNKLATTGDKQFKAGQKLVTKGRSALSEGELLVTSGNLEVETNRLNFQTLSQTNGTIMTGDSAVKRVAQLEKAADAWQAGDKKIVKGNKLIQSGNLNVTKGEAEINKGQALLSAGQEKMQNAESLYESSAQ